LLTDFSAKNSQIDIEVINDFGLNTSKSMMFSRSFMRRQATCGNMMLQQPRRFFDLHEFHSKQLMATYGINV